MHPPVSCSEKRGAGLGALSALTGRTSPSTRGWNRAGGRGFRQDGLRAADKGSFLEEGPWDTGHCESARTRTRATRSPHLAAAGHGVNTTLQDFPSYYRRAHNTKNKDFTEKEQT